MAKAHWLRMATKRHDLSKLQTLLANDGKRPLAKDGNQAACFVQTPSACDGCDAVEIWPINLVDRVQSILQLPIRQPSRPEFSFELTMESAEKNYMLLMKKYSGSLKAALEAQHESQLGMGSEFRLIEILHSIYSNHPIWSRMVPVLQQGSTWPLDHLSKDLRLTDVLEAINFVNHKGAKSNPEAILKLVSKDVKHG